jgi:stage II sporulation protein D
MNAKKRSFLSTLDLRLSAFICVPFLFTLALFADSRPLPRPVVAELAAKEGAALVLDSRSRAVVAQYGSAAALDEPHATGSAIKPLVALLALESGAIGPDMEVLCRRQSGPLGCSHPAALLPYRIEDALAFSCNYFFAEVGRRVGRARLEEGFRRIGLQVEASDPALAATGAAGVRASPRQLLALMMDMAAGRLRFRSAHTALVKSALARAVRDGTAKAASVAGLAIAGKTGTAAWPGTPYRNSGWFVGWAPADEPRLALVVWVKTGEGKQAAALAGRILRGYLGSRQPPTAAGLQRRDAEHAEKTQRETAPLRASAPSPARRGGLASLRCSVQQSTCLAVQVRPRGGGPAIVRLVELEDYVAGVLAGEAGELTQPEALKAMAVAARSFAIRSRGRHAPEGFDFCSLTHCQVYTSQAPGKRFRTAARATAGQVLGFNGEVIRAYYTGNCGGHSQSAANVWPDQAVSYLPAQPDPFCVRDGKSPARNARWTTRLPAAQLEAALRSEPAMDPGGRLNRLAVLQRDATGRVRRLEITGSVRHEVDGNHFRFLIGRRLGWEKLKSTAFEVRREGGDFLFQGRGFGHGVGLCQAGAVRMAEAGFDYCRILAQYYPGTELAEWHSLQAVQPVGGPVRPASLQRQAVSSQHFTVSFATGQRPDAEDVLRLLEAAQSRFAPRGIQAPPGRITVVLHASTADFIKATGKPGWVAATADSQGGLHLQPPAVLRSRGTLEATLSHEYLHLALWNATDPRVPAWFREGLVLFFTGERVDAPPAAAGASSATLEQAIERPRSRDEMRRAYARALEETRRLARELGEPALLRLLRQPSESELKRLVTVGQTAP